MAHVRFDKLYSLGRKTVRGRFAVPSGIRCTHAATIRKTFREIPSIGVITTKSISAQPRKGYREPLYARYAPGCYINAVGLSNPGAREFLAECRDAGIPEDKFLLVSVFGSDVDSFVEAASILEPVADGFELNMSCPHAKGYGAQIGQDMDLMRTITERVVRAVRVPVFVKLAASFVELSATAKAAMAAGAAGITVSNTIGPAVVSVGVDPILHNKFGGLSGDGIRPLALRAVEQVRQAIGDGPAIIGMGGIAAPEHVRQFEAAGADVFGVGSALTGLDSPGFAEYMAGLERDVLDGCGAGYGRSCESALPMDYFRTRVAGCEVLDGSLFKLILERLPGDYRDGELAGKFFFLCRPGAGEKPFAIFSAAEKSVVVRVVGEFTRHLAGLTPGDEILLRGPYGRGVPEFEGAMVVHVGGGTGIASLLEIARKFGPGNRQIFLLGARTREHLFGVAEFERLGPVHLATDDGTAGHNGYAPELLAGVLDGLSEGERGRLVFVNCGPEPMVRRCFEVQRGATSEERILGSIEYMTSCGVGICGKCSSPSGALTCIDGPFLPVREFRAG